MELASLVPKTVKYVQQMVMLPNVLHAKRDLRLIIRAVVLKVEPKIYLNLIYKVFIKYLFDKFALAYMILY